MFGDLLTDINAQSRKCLHRQRMDRKRVTSSAQCFNTPSTQMTQNALCHLRSGTVMGTKEENTNRSTQGRGSLLMWCRTWLVKRWMECISRCEIQQTKDIEIEMIINGTLVSDAPPFRHQM